MKNLLKKSTLKAVVVCLFLAIAFSTVFAFSKLQNRNNGLNVSTEQTEHSHETQTETFVIDYINGTIKSMSNTADADVSNNSNHTATTKGIKLETSLFVSNVSLTGVEITGNPSVSVGDSHFCIDNIAGEPYSITFSVNPAEVTNLTCCGEPFVTVEVKSSTNRFTLDCNSTPVSFSEVDPTYTGEITIQATVKAKNPTLEVCYINPESIGASPEDYYDLYSFVEFTPESYDPNAFNSVEGYTTLVKNEYNINYKDGISLNGKWLLYANNLDNCVDMYGNKLYTLTESGGKCVTLSLGEKYIITPGSELDGSGNYKDYKKEIQQWSFEYSEKIEFDVMLYEGTEYAMTETQTFYVITSMKGHMHQWQNSTWMDAVGEKGLMQSSTAPVLVLMLNDKGFNFTAKAGTSQWDSVTSGLTEVNESITNLRGVKDGDGKVSTSKTYTNVTGTSEWDFSGTSLMVGDAKAFNVSNDLGIAGNNIGWFNYGYKVKSYQVLMTFTDNSKSYLTLDGGKLKLSTSEVSLTMAQLETINKAGEQELFGLGTILGLANVSTIYSIMYYNQYQSASPLKSFQSIEITPTWEAVDVNLIIKSNASGGKDKTLSTKFGSTVDLNTYVVDGVDASGDKVVRKSIDGTTLYAFQLEGLPVALKGPWNYLPKDITMRSNYFKSNKWSITLNPAYASDVAVLELQNIPDDENGYTLTQQKVDENGEIVNDDSIYYTFAESANAEKNTNNITFIGSVETSEYNDTTHKGLVSIFVSYLADEKIKYENDLAGKGDSSYANKLGLGKVHYTAGTKDSQYRLSKVASQKLFIHTPYSLPIEPQVMPMFKSKYETVVLWKNDTLKVALPTLLYNDQFSQEVPDGYNIKYMLQYSDNKVLTAINITQVYLYYNNPEYNSTTYASKEGKFFSENTTLGISELGSEINIKDNGIILYEFGGWVFDADKAIKHGYELETNKGILTAKREDNDGSTKTTTFAFSKILNPSSPDELRKYFITSVKGAVFKQNDNEPIIKIKWTVSHKITFKNSDGNYWAQAIDGGKLPNTTTLDQLEGVAINTYDNGTEYGSSGSMSVSGNKGRFGSVVFQNPKIHNWAFSRKDDLIGFINDNDGNGYALYNFGSEITGYYISFVDKSDNSIKYVTINDSNKQWDLISYQQETNISSISEAKLTICDLANFVDDYLLANNIELSSHEITIVPLWNEKAAMTINNSETFRFGDGTYSISLNHTDPRTTPYAVRLRRGSIIALSGKWNYYQDVSSDDFVYDASTSRYEVQISEVLYATNYIKVELCGLDNLLSDWVDYNTLKISNLTSTPAFISFIEYDSKVKELNGGVSDYAYIGNYAENGNNHFLMDDYVAELDANIQEYTRKQDNALIYNVLICPEGSSQYFVYLAHNKTPNLPYFKDYLSQIVLWSDDNTKLAYKPNYVGQYDYSEYEMPTGYSLNTNEWEAQGNNTDAFTAVYVYSVELFYGTKEDDSNFEKVNTSSLEYIEDGQGYFGNTSLNLYDDQNKQFIITPTLTEDENANVKIVYDRTYEAIIQTISGNPWRIFEGWVIDVESTKLASNGYSLFDIASNKVIIKDNNNHKWEFVYNGNNKFNTNLYYLTGVAFGSGRFVQSQTNPIVTAKWSYLYDMTIDNSSSSILWNVNTISEEERTNLFGAIGNNEQDEHKATVQIANHWTLAGWQFMNSEGRAFTDESDSLNNMVKPDTDRPTSPWYYIYNYGHYITGYTIEYGDINELVNGKYFVWDYDEEWSKDGDGYTEIDPLAETSLPDLAHALDELMLGNGWTSTLKLTMIPSWDEVKVKAVDANEKSEIVMTKKDYNTNYVINEGAYESHDDQSIMAYYYVNDSDKETALPSGTNLIAGTAKWNYRKIDKNYYTYSNDTGLLGQGTYTIMLKPVYVDNIYKIAITDARAYETQDGESMFELEDTDFVFNSISGYNNKNNSAYANVMTYNNVNHDGTGFDYTYRDWISEGASADVWADDYVNSGSENDCLSSWLSIYQEAITTGVAGVDGTHWFSCLRKVFYNTGDVNEENNLQLTINSNASLSMYICLVNGQSYGSMPMFKNKYYQLIFWENAYSTDNNQDPSKNYYAYKTLMFDRDDPEHQEEINGFELHTIGEGNEDNPVWFYTDGHSTHNTFELNAHYFRKYFYLRTETIQETLESDHKARRGYVVIVIDDESYKEDNKIENKSGKYVFMYDYETQDMLLYRFDYDNANQKFDLESDIQWASLVENNLKADGTIFQSADKNTICPAIPVYAGCSISMHVIDQSQDVKAMKTGYYDDMIGYKFNGKIEQEYYTYQYQHEDEKPTLFDAENNGYKPTIAPGNENNPDDTGILSKGYANKSLVILKIKFEEIEYTIDFDIDLKMGSEIDSEDIVYDFYSGGFKLNENISYAKLENYKLTVEDVYNLKYVPQAGFKLQNNAFKLKITEYVSVDNLQNYSEAIEELSEDEKNKYLVDGVFSIQKYLSSQQWYLMQLGNLSSDADNNKPYKTFANTLDGTWLREYFYNQIGDDYDVNNNDLGSLVIQTMPITFNFGLKVYDPTDTASADVGHIIGEDKLSNYDGMSPSNDQIKYTKFVDRSMAYMEVCNFENTYFSDDIGFYYYDLNGTKYAVLNSRMYYPNINNNDILSYQFLLREIQSRNRLISSSILSRMVRNYQDGEIIPTDDRNIFVMIEVRKLLTIDMEVAYDENLGDPNAVERSTTITNGDNNENTLTIYSGTNHETYNNGLNDVKRYTTTCQAYTYYGLENMLTSYLGLNDNYSSVEYYLNYSTEKLSSDQFSITNHAILTIKFIPKELAIEYKYYYNGIETDLESLVDEGFITEVRPSDDIKLLVGIDLCYTLTGLKAKHIYKVTLNNTLAGQSKMNLPIELKHPIDEEDYANGKVVIRVDITPIEDTEISIEYRLNDVREGSYLDEYGDIKVYQTLAGHTEEIADDSNNGVFKIAEDGSVEVELQLTDGFYYTTKVYVDTNSPIEIPLDAATNRIKLIDKFDPKTSGKLYVIEIAKTPIKVTLSLDGVNTAAGASYKINNSTVVNGLHVNSTINFSGTAVNEQRFDYYYYLNSANEKIKIENVSMNYSSFAITSELLKNAVADTYNYSADVLELKLGVATVDRVMAEFTIKGSDYVEEFSVQINGVAETSLRQQYVEGGIKYSTRYCDVASSELTFKLTTKVPGKYYIVLKNQDNYSIEDDVKADRYDKIDFEDVKVVLDRNYNDVIEVSPYSYQTTIKESVYTTLQEIDDGIPTLVDASQHVNKLSANGLTYGQVGTLIFARETNDRELSVVYLTGNDIDSEYNIDKIRIEFNKTNFVVYKNDSDEVVSAKDCGLTIENIDDNVKISFTTRNDISIEFEYILYKNIKF